MAKDPRALLQQAEALRKSGRLSDAIDACLKALETQPGLDALRVTLGRTYLESGQADLAKQTLADVFARLPEHHLAGKLLAEAQKETGEGNAAEETCLKLLATYPRDREIEALLKSVREAGPRDRSAAGAAATPPEPVPARAAAPMRPVTPAPAEPAARAAATEAEVDPLPDYVPEDVAGGAPELTPPRPAVTSADAPAAMSATMAASTATGTPDAPPTPAATAPAAAPTAISPTPTPTPASAPPVPEAKAPGRDALQTNTLAELYVKQGLVDRAVEVYRGMLKVDPTNERARRRLEELQSAPAPESAAAPAASAVARPAPAARVVPATPAPAAPAAPAAFADPAAASRAAAIRRLEEWLSQMQRGRDADRRAGR